jgi:hypothetical protein
LAIKSSTLVLVISIIHIPSETFPLKLLSFRYQKPFNFRIVSKMELEMTKRTDMT